MKASVIEDIASDYYEKLEFLGVTNPGIHLSFSAVPGSGKTTLARRLSGDLRAQYIQADEVRRMLNARHEEVTSDIVRSITGRVIERIFKEDSNQSIIIDASIDRSWSTFYDFAKKCAARTFVIRLSIPADVIRQRLLARDGAVDEMKMQRFKNDFEVGKAHIAADIELNADYDYDEVLASVRSFFYLTAK